MNAPPVSQLELGERAVVAGEAQVGAYSWIDESLGELGDTEGDRDRLEAQRADLDLPPSGGVDRRELGVGSEAAAGEVDRGQLLVEDRPRRRKCGRLGNCEERTRPEHGEGLRRNAHEPPETATGGLADCAGAWTGADCAGAWDDGPVGSSEGAAGVVGTGTSVAVVVREELVVVPPVLLCVPAPAT